jgi:hypothetical protein
MLAATLSLPAETSVQAGISGSNGSSPAELIPPVTFQKTEAVLPIHQ